MRIVAASEFDNARLAAVFEAGYENYFTPIHVDESAFAYMVGAWDIDLDRSWVALADEEPVGVTMLGVRGDVGWVGGLGVVSTHRRRGLGRALMETLLASAPPTVYLEVIEQNTPALRLYEDLGFEHTRMLEVWSLRAETPPADARTVEPAPLGESDVPWQRADGSLSAGGYERIEVDGGAALIRVGGPNVSVLQLVARDEQAAAQLLSAARGHGEALHFVNVPEGDPASAALRSLGGHLDLRQFEMRRASRG
jgi:ribosomal protein S18 acetylase RimI-like enzyme